MFNSKFDNKKRILELLKMKKSYFESGMYDNGHILAVNRANSHIDKNTMLKDELSGIGSYLFVKKIIKEVETNFENFVDRLEKIYKKIFTSSLEINITSSKNDFEKVKDIIINKFDSLPPKDDGVEIEFQAKSYKEAIQSDANVNYVAQTANIKELGKDFDGKIMLASSILSNPYLYELIRAKGGAYGAGLTASKTGLLSAYSYRDPNILATIENFEKISELTKSIDISDRDFENQQISSMGSILRPKSPSALADEDYVRYKKENPTDPNKLLSEIKSSNLDEIKGHADLFKEATEKENICIFGNRDNITDVKDKFDKIIDLND